MEYQLCPSILSADFNRLGEQIQILEKKALDIRKRLLVLEPLIREKKLKIFRSI